MSLQLIFNYCLPIDPLETRKFLPLYVKVYWILSFSYNLLSSLT